MNVYDFDKTIFYPDSTVTYLTYSLFHCPREFEQRLPYTLPALLRFIRSGDFHDLKEELFSFQRYVGDLDSYVEKFWDKNISKIGQWYLDQQKEDDLVISASPEFLVAPVARRLGFELIATPLDPYSGNIEGVNCKGSEKVRRFRERYPDAEVDEFYSDSLSDAPMARLAKKAFLVTHHELSPWPEEELTFYGE